MRPQEQKVCRVRCESGEADNLAWQWRNYPEPAKLTQKLWLFDDFCHFFASFIENTRLPGASTGTEIFLDQF